MGAEGTDPEMEDSGFDQLQANLQKMVIEDDRQSYSEIVVEHAMNPRNAGVMEDADGYGSSFGNCGDSIEMWLKVKDKQISRISFWTDGCGATSAAASITTEMAQNRSLAQAQQRLALEIFCRPLAGFLPITSTVPRWRSMPLRTLSSITWRLSGNPGRGSTASCSVADTKAIGTITSR